MESEIHYIYANPKQDAFFNSQKQIKVFIGGRGSGKSTVLGDELYECMMTMPRSRGFIASATDETVKNFSLPSIIQRLEELGEIQDEDFVVGKRPPHHFVRPYNPPSKYQSIISFSNGTCCDIISMYGKNAGRGGNYQWGFIDEAALIDKETHDKALMGAMRGLKDKVARIDIDPEEEVPYGKIKELAGRTVWEIPFSENPRYRMRAYVSTMPWTRSAQWLLDFEEDERAEFIESTAWDNIEILGQEYIEDMRATLPPAVYAVEMENFRPKKIANGFYPDFNDDIHSTTNSLYNPSKGLEISLDFNAGFNSMIICQVIGEVAYIHDELYVKGNMIVEDLIDKFTAKYASHPTKELEIFGDRNGNSRHANSRYTIYERIEKKLRESGWNYHRPHKGLDAPHKAKHEMLGLALKEKAAEKLPRVRVNRLNCKGLILSIANAPMMGDFKKDKKSETKLKDTDYREEATDLSDCFDNWYVFRFKHLMEGMRTGGGSAPGMGIGGM